MDLPKDLVLNILFRLPVICLFRFRCVCKSWCAIFSDPNFIYKNLLSDSDSEDLNVNSPVLFKRQDYDSRYFVFSFLSCDTFDMSAPQEIPYPKDIIEKCSFIDIVGSCCNGLICLRDVYYSEHLRNVWVDSYNYDSNIVLWNPTTTETKILPQSNVPLPPDSFISLEIVDFGFDARTSDCKVLRIFEYVSLDSQWGYLVEIYSLRDDTWRKVDVNLNSWQLPSYKYDDIYYYGRGHTGANGTFHWWAREDNWKYVIVSFELSKDAIKTTALPDTINPRNSWQTTFCLNGYIALPFCDNNHVELWVLLEYGVKESWTKLFTIACPENVSQPLGFSSNGKLFLATWEGQLLVWNPTTEAIFHIRVNGVPETLQTVTYMESYIPLKIGNKFKDEQNSREANQS